MRLKSFIWHFRALFCKLMYRKSYIWTNLKRAAWWYFYIILILFVHFWAWFYVKMCAILCNNIVYLYVVCDVFSYKKVYKIALFLCLEWVKYCGKVCGKLSDFLYECGVNLSVWRVVFMRLWDNFIWFYVVFLSGFLVCFWCDNVMIFNSWMEIKCDRM